MLAALFEYFQQQMGRAVENLGVIAKSGSAVHVAFEAHDTVDSLQVASGLLELRDGVQRGLAGCLVASFDRHLRAQPAGVEYGPVLPGKLAGGEYQISGPHPGDISADAGGWFRHDDSQSLEVFEGGHSAIIYCFQAQANPFTPVKNIS